MTEPVSTLSASSAIAAIAAAFLQLSGIDMPPVLWAGIGAAFMQGYSQVEASRFRVAVQVLGAAMLGGLLGTVAGSIVGGMGGASPRHLVLLLSAVAGFGAQPVFQSLLDKLIQKIGEK